MRRRGACCRRKRRSSTSSRLFAARLSWCLATPGRRTSRPLWARRSSGSTVRPGRNGTVRGRRPTSRSRATRSVSAITFASARSRRCVCSIFRWPKSRRRNGSAAARVEATDAASLNVSRALARAARFRCSPSSCCGLRSRPRRRSPPGRRCAIAGEALRIWAAGHLNKSREVTSSGPYRWFAHPLYVGSSIMGVGLAVASGSVARRGVRRRVSRGDAHGRDSERGGVSAPRVWRASTIDTAAGVKRRELIVGGESTAVPRCAGAWPTASTARRCGRGASRYCC